jgi:hypothetical protein
MTSRIPVAVPVGDNGLITPAELKCILGWLGLSRPWLAERLSVSERQVIRWEDGTSPIPEHVSLAVTEIWDEAADRVSQMIADGIASARDGVVTLRTYRVDEEDPDNAYPASYHRALTTRTMDHILMRTQLQVQLRFWYPDGGL